MVVKGRRVTHRMKNSANVVVRWMRVSRTGSTSTLKKIPGTPEWGELPFAVRDAILICM
jgi:hypothetical protein